MVRVGYAARRTGRFAGLALALAVLLGGFVGGADASGGSGGEYRRPEAVTVALPGEGQMAYARIVLRRLPFGTTLRKPALPAVTVANRELLPDAVTVFARVATHGKRGEAIPEFVVDIAVLRPAGVPGAVRRPAPADDHLRPRRARRGHAGTESAALRRRSFRPRPRLLRPDPVASPGGSPPGARALPPRRRSQGTRRPVTPRSR